MSKTQREPSDNDNDNVDEKMPHFTIILLQFLSNALSPDQKHIVSWRIIWLVSSRVS